MNAIEAFEYSSCASFRKTKEVLNQPGVDNEVRVSFRNRYSVEELKSILDGTGLPFCQLLS